MWGNDKSEGGGGVTHNTGGGMSVGGDKSEGVGQSKDLVQPDNNK